LCPLFFPASFVFPLSRSSKELAWPIPPCDVLFLHLRLMNVQAFRPDNDGQIVSLRNFNEKVQFVFSLRHGTSCSVPQRVDKVRGAWMIGPARSLDAQQRRWMVSAPKRDAGRGQTSGCFDEVRLVSPVFPRVFRFSAEPVVKGARLAHHSMRCTFSPSSVDEWSGLSA